jgi:hypothetical protein
MTSRKKRLDNLPKPCTFYYEDTEGNNIPYDRTSCAHPTVKWAAQHSKSVEVHESICFGSSVRSNKDAWPVRAIKWVLYHAPASWKKPVSCITFNSSINCGWPIIKYLVEKRKWSLNEAGVAASELCERCLNRVLDDIGGVQQPMGQQYYDAAHTSCKSCQYIDLEHYNKVKMKAAYQALKHGENIAKCFKEGWCGPKQKELLVKPIETEKWYKKIFRALGRKKGI